MIIYTDKQENLTITQTLLTTNGAKLYDLRKRRFGYPLSKRIVSISIGISEHIQQYTRYENGVFNINQDHIQKLCDFYHISPEYFIDTKVGLMTAYIPHFESFEKKRDRIMFKDFDQYHNLAIFKSNCCQITNYFVCSLPEGSYEDFPYNTDLLKYTYPRSLTNLPTKDIQYIDFESTGSKTNAPLILFERCDGCLPVEDNQSEIFLVYNKKNYKTSLIRFTYCPDEKVMSVIPIYNFDKQAFYDLADEYTNYERDINHPKISNKDLFEITKKSVWSILDIYPIGRAIAMK